MGVSITANVHTTGNANRWKLRDLIIKDVCHAGVYVDGPDTNAGLAEGIAVLNACGRAVYWSNKLGIQAAGIIDSSFLGNTWVACMVDSSIDSTVSPATLFPGYRHEGDNSHSAFVGCYTERSNLTNQLARWGIALGGIGKWEGLGLRVGGPYFNSIVVRNEKDPNNIVEVAMGQRAASGTFIEYISHAIDRSRPLRFKANATTKEYIFDIANTLKIGILSTLGAWWKPKP